MATSYVTVGREVDGDPARLHPTAARWWKLFVRLVRLVLGLELEIIQAKGGYAGSAGTHDDGWAIDLRTWKFTTAQILAIVALARLCGASATWYRLDVGSGPHIHLVVDAGALYTASRYQTRAVRAGYDGLGYLGRKNPDPHPAPPVWRTAEEGIAYMTTTLNRIEGEIDMDPQELKALIKSAVREELVAYGWTPLHKDSSNGIARSSRNNNDIHVSLNTQQTAADVRTIKAQIDKLLKAVQS